MTQIVPVRDESIGWMDLVVDIASGKATKAELNNEREIAIWKQGVTL